MQFSKSHTARQVAAHCGPCDNADACCQALEQTGTDAGVPSFCRSAEMFMRLQKEVEQATGPVAR